MSREKWLPVASYTGIYAPTHEVSSCGRVRRADSKKIMTLSLGKRGYLQVELCSPAGRKTIKVHKLVIESFVGLRPTPKTQINHKDGIKTNNNIRNLEFCTAKENIWHYRKARNPVSRRAAPKSELARLLIAARLESNITLREAGAKSGVDAGTLSSLETDARSNMTLRTLVSVARAYSLCPSALVAAAIKDAEL